MKGYCPVCESSDQVLRSSYRGTHKIFIGLMRAQCRACCMVYAVPMPSETALHEYNARYFSAAHGGTPNGSVALAFFSGIARLRITFLEHYLDAQQVVVSRLLEFGPGPGFFAARWLERHPDTTYLAFETDTSCHPALAKLGVSLVEAAPLADGTAQVDLVVMSHVLEHIATPRTFLEHATKNLRKGGVLFIEVPCMDYEHKLIDEPHLLFFDKKPMQYLLGASGFDNIEIGYFGRGIDELRNSSALQRSWMALRARLISRGLVAPFAWSKAGMEELTSPIERAVVAPFKAHRQSSKPAWWLRAVARKRYAS